MNAKFALANGLIDEIVDDLFEGGMAFAKKVAAEGRPLVKVRDNNEKLEEAKQDAELFDRFRKKIARKTRGFDSPEAIIQCVEDTLTKSFDEGILAERERFMKLITGAKSEAQRYYFFSERLANKILDEGMSQRPSDIDVVWVNGYGWPTYRGGPMHYADTIGLENILAKLKQFQEQDQDDFWQPSPLIERLVEDGKGFKDMN